MSDAEESTRRRIRNRRWAGSPAATALMLTGALVTLVAGAVTGWGATGLLDYFRLSSVLQLGLSEELSGELPTTIPMTPAYITLFLSVPALVGGAAWYQAANRLWSGRRDVSVGIGPYTLVAVPVAVTVWLLCSLVIDSPPELREAWENADLSLRDQLMYWSTVWVPVVLLCAAVIIWRIERGWEKRHDPVQDLAAQLLQADLRAHGQVTGVEVLTDAGTDADTAAPEGQSVVRWVVRFRELGGPAWCVTFVEPFWNDRIPKVGGERWLLYDPAQRDPARAAQASGEGVPLVFMATGDSSLPQNYALREPAAAVAEQAPTRAAGQGSR
ncbi:hypothetical protein [Corynebacterium nuruki]|uniref:hypothetical protein n=1 Tax=Corynebacterium nuruki TaxID=1032851 RepID=UPI0039BEEA36